MKRLSLVGISLIGLILPLFTFAQVIATDVQCSPPGCVGAVDLANNAITTTKLSNNAVITAKIMDGTILNVDINAIAAIDPSKILGTAWTSNNDGIGSGLDADFLDGIQGSQFLRNDASGSIVTTGNTSLLIHANDLINDRFPSLDLRAGNTDAGAFSILQFSKTAGVSNESLQIQNGSGVTMMTVNGGGNVGIGVTLPAQPLEVKTGTDGIATAGSTAIGGFRIHGTTFYNTVLDMGIGAGGISGNTWLQATDATDLSQKYTLSLNPNGGNVGIGTTNPEIKLQINETGTNVALRTYGKLEVFGNSLGAGSTLATIRGYNESPDSDANILAVGTSGATDWEHLVVKAGGNVGIGTTAPGNRLDVRRVDNTDGDAISFGSQSYVMGRLGEDVSTNKVYIANTYNNDASYIDFRLRGNGAANSKMVIQGNGNVGIGLTNPANALSVYMPYMGNADTRISLANDYVNMGLVGRSNEYGQFRIGLVDDSGNETISSRGGNVGIGMITPSYKLDIAGSVNGSSLCMAGDCRTSWPAGGGGGVDGDGTAGRLAKWSGNTTLDETNLYISSSNLGIDTGGDPVIDLAVGDTNTGLQLADTDALAIYTAGIERLRVTSGGNVKIVNDLGIGIAPDIDLAIGDSDTGFKQEGDGVLSLFTNNTRRMIVNSIGNFGINTSSADTKYMLRVDSNSVTDDTAAIVGNSWGNTGNITGVYGTTHSDGMGSGSPAGVFGWATYTGQGGDTFGVLGRTSTKGGYDPNYDATAVALYGEATATSGFSMGAWGETFSSTNGASGVRGVANVNSGTVYGVLGESKSSSGYGIYSIGDMGVTGDKPAIVYTESQGPSKLYAVEATETWFEDFGFGQLQNGYAKITLDPLYLETVVTDSTHPYHVFVQSYDAPVGSSLTVRKGNGFIEVLDTTNPQSSMAFSYRIVAKRKYHADERMETTQVPIDMFMRPDLDAVELQQLNDRWERKDYRLLAE